MPKTWAAMAMFLLVGFTLAAQEAQRSLLEVKIQQLAGQNAIVGKQYVVLIAIDKYKSWPALRNPVKDAREIGNILATRYYVDELLELYDEKATAAGMQALFSNLVKGTRPEDSVLIFYAGHGHLDEASSSGFWIPVDGDAALMSTWIPNSIVRGYIKNMKARHIALISDSCFSGDILDPSRGKPSDISDEYFRSAYERVSRQVLTSGASETVPDESTFARQLRLTLEGNTQPYLDPLMLYTDIRLGVKGSTPLFGELKDVGHQTGGSLLLFLKDTRQAAQPSRPQESSAQPSVAAGTFVNLVISTEPAEAEVWVGGAKQKEKSPVLVEKVKAGQTLKIVARKGSMSAEIDFLPQRKLDEVTLVLEQERGSLFVRSAESAVEVWVDGSLVGPLGSGLVKDLPVGTRTLELKASGVYGKTSVEVRKDEVTRVEPALVEVGRVSYSIPSDASASLEKGGASRALDGSSTIENLPVGTYKARAWGTGYEEEKSDIVVTRGAEARYEPFRTGGISVVTDPAGAEVSMNGVARGASPLTLRGLDRATYTVTAKKEGYEEARGSVTVQGGKVLPMSFPMKVKPKIPEGFALSESGTYSMGDGSSDAAPEEKPVHSVTVSSFLIARYEVTFAQYDKFCEETSKGKPGDEGWGRGNRPVINVSWLDAVAYCNWLSDKENLARFYTVNGTSVVPNWSANGYRLPTEAEWEFAARGGRAANGTKYAGGNGPASAGWYWGNSQRMTHPAGEKQPNEIGLFDMSGNVWEWCNDWHGSYSAGSQSNPRGPDTGEFRVLRGGSWFNDANAIRISNRDRNRPDSRSSTSGFRVARTAS